MRRIDVEAMARERRRGVMTRKRDDNSPETEPKAELKNPDRRHLLGAAALAAFTVGQAGSAAAAQARHAKKPRAAAPAECPPPWGDPPDSPADTGHGMQEAPDKHPAGYMEPSTFGPLPGGQVIFHDAKAYRQKVTKYAKKLRKAMNLDTDFTHIVRLEHVGPGASALDARPKSADCGCGCS
jgi:hypothetical protein